MEQYSHAHDHYGGEDLYKADVSHAAVLVHQKPLEEDDVLGNVPAVTAVNPTEHKPHVDEQVPLHVEHLISGGVDHFQQLDIGELPTGASLTYLKHQQESPRTNFQTAAEDSEEVFEDEARIGPTTNEEELAAQHTWLYEHNKELLPSHQ